MSDTPLRSRLKTVKKTQHGKDEWHARGDALLRRPDGTLYLERKQRILRGATKVARDDETARWNEWFDEKALSTQIKFCNAFETYLNLKYDNKEGKKRPIHWERLVVLLGEYDIHGFTDKLMIDTAAKLFRPGAKASTKNRDLYTPVIATLQLALKKAAPTLTRPEGHRDIVRKPLPGTDWFSKVMPLASPRMRALAAFVTGHGRRLGDALGRTPADFDPVAGTIFIDSTKNGTPRLVRLHPEITKLITEIPDWQTKAWLFGSGPNARSNIYRELRELCAEAGVGYFTPHVFGRHVFAIRMLMAGYSLQVVKEEGGWKSIKVLSDYYGHLEQSSTTHIVHAAVDQELMTSWGRRGGEAVSIPYKLTPDASQTLEI